MVQFYSSRGMIPPFSLFLPPLPQQFRINILGLLVNTVLTVDTSNLVFGRAWPVLQGSRKVHNWFGGWVQKPL